MPQKTHDFHSHKPLNVNQPHSNFDYLTMECFHLDSPVSCSPVRKVIVITTIKVHQICF